MAVKEDKEFPSPFGVHSFLIRVEEQIGTTKYNGFRLLSEFSHFLWGNILEEYTVTTDNNMFPSPFRVHLFLISI